MAESYRQAGPNDGLNQLLEGRWWALVLRGLVSLLFGIACFVSPRVVGTSLVLLFAIFSIIDGLFGLGASAGAARRGERWGWLAVESVASIVIGVMLLTMPVVTLTVLFYIMAVKAAITGVFLLLSSIRLDGAHGRGLMALSGVINVGFAVILFMSPMLGLKILLWWIGLWAILIGLVMLLLGVKLKRLTQPA